MNRVIDRIKKRFSFKRTTSQINTGKERSANVTTKTNIPQESDEIDGFSDSPMKKPEKLGMSREIAKNFGKINNEILHVNKTLIEMTQAIQGQNDKILTLEREMLELNNLKSLEQELKNAIQVQTDGIK